MAIWKRVAVVTQGSLSYTTRAGGARLGEFATWKSLLSAVLGGRLRVLCVSLDGRVKSFLTCFFVPFGSG